VTTFLGGIVSQVARMRFRSFPAFEEAVAFLREADGTLKSLT
jgi:hypothetical protein